MLEKLREYDNLGTPAYFLELFKELDKEDAWTVNEVAEHFSNRVIDGRNIFDGCLHILLSAGIIATDDYGTIEVTPAYRKLSHSLQFCRQKLLEAILLALKDDPDFIEALTPERISYDFINKVIKIDFSVFGFRYANLRQLLIDFNFLRIQPDSPNKIMTVTPKWRQFFEARFVTEIRKKIGIEDIRKQQLRQQKNGEIAERFVMQFENKRLNNKESIQWIAPYDAGAGFDILSFKNTSSTDNDYFIEVKSYSGSNPYFYWTKNEIKKAKNFPNEYCIYLVNRDKLEERDYKPSVIPNPAKNILDNNNWIKTADTYYITEAQ